MAMIKYRCVTKCFHNSRLWSPGEILEAPKGQVPHHFVPEKKYQAPKELTQEEQDLKAAKAVGHEAPSNDQDIWG